MYKFNEDKIIRDIKDYIDGTYSQHYSKGIQTAEILELRSRARDFYIGNIYKYIDRYGQKEGYNKKDLYKIIHYVIMLINLQEKMDASSKETRA